MNALELYHLRRLCDKWGIDYQEIDDTLTYWENKKHIYSLVAEAVYPLDPTILRRWESLEEQYRKEHFLIYYVCCIQDGLTISEEIGLPIPHYPRFSLETYIQQSHFFWGEECQP